jgi:beta-1,4-N-acetylglucosaminyltransferase
MQIEYYRLNPHYKRDVAAADLVISHAGAGSIMDALSFKRKLLVVVNTLLMDNHQTELAEAMTEKNYCFQTTCKELVETIEKADFTKLKDYPEPDENAFPSVINGLMGVIT